MSGRRLAVLALALATLAALVLPGPVRNFFFHENLHEIVPGIWRSAQPDGDELDRMIRELGLRSVLNLRGERGNNDWYANEVETTQRHDVPLYTVRLNADRLPPSQRLREVVRVLDEAPRPLLLHCQGGVERSGLVAAVAVLLSGGDLDRARQEFAFTRGFVGWLARSDLPLALAKYERWLAARGVPHTPERLREWVASDYSPYFYRARIEPLGVPAALDAGREATLRFRVTNTSEDPLPLRDDPARGVRLGARVQHAGDAKPRLELRGRLVDLELAPGAATELELTLPPLAEPGRWTLHVDLVDEGVKWFADMGSSPLELALDVHPGAGA